MAKLTTEEFIDEVEESGLYDENQTKVDLDGLSSLSKDVKKSAVYLDDKQIRLVIDQYYATQKHRINIENQIRAVRQGFDETPEGEQPAISWLLMDVRNRENQIKKLIAEYVKYIPVCQWATAVKGIGPIFAAILYSYIDMSKCKHANQFISYCGLNDNNTPWLGKEKARDIVNEAWAHFGLNPKDEPDDNVLLRVAVNSGRNLNTVKKGFALHRENNSGAANPKTQLINYMAKPPYNTFLKKVLYLVGQSFIKVSNRGSLYGTIYKERKALETMKNEQGDYADQAKHLLETYNYDKTTDTYKYLSQGKLSPDHINMRASRYAEKIFLTHFFEACYIDKYKINPPTIYPIAFQGHVDYIGPEVPYENYFVWDKNKRG